jgi:hypothetical protein
MRQVENNYFRQVKMQGASYVDPDGENARPPSFRPRITTTETDSNGEDDIESYIDRVNELYLERRGI